MDSAADRLITLKVKDAMTRQVICVSRDQLLSDAARLFVEKGISGAPVIDQHGICVGVLSATDYVRREDAHRQTPGTAAAGDRVADEMSPQPLSIRPEQTLLTAARIMCDQHVHRLPVLSSSGHVEGLITSMDVVAALGNAMDEREASGR
jgi:CBS domain-containing protein